ncbi:MarR family winged helix-turn-helix transcriptional regulator [Saxibacter everestensis]|uniref:MarR family winged helix-turn-helix transcriptional regulator n=1 Tax=Saxibacter everestensis TaxID=2909229 RepID=A0ABY8QUK5_9MICO|nr:MarR family winged helix-turn-helix transcriptional regulator [Brevibacteriaceae bacterium ZFBP1038]
MSNVKLAAESWESLFRAQVTLMRRFAADDIWQPISMREYDVLFTLSHCPEGLRLNDLNEEILISQPSLSRMVERLEAKGLVVKEPAADDRRGTRIRLSEAGARMQKQIGRRHVASIAKYLGPALSDDEMKSLQLLCTKLRHAQAEIPD